MAAIIVYTTKVIEFATKNIPPTAMQERTALYPHNPAYTVTGDAPRPRAVKVLTVLPRSAKAADIGEQIAIPTSMITPQAVSGIKYT